MGEKIKNTIKDASPYTINKNTLIRIKTGWKILLKPYILQHRILLRFLNLIGKF